MVLLVVTAVAPAAAQQPAAPTADEATRNRARQKLVQGVDLLRSGDYSEALARFQEAYIFVPSPKIHYNFGLAYLGLARRAEALAAFEKFLAEATDATKDTRDKAEEHSRDLRTRVAFVEVTADQAGADVLLDGRTVGQTPLARPLYVDLGPHQIVVQIPGSGQPYLERIAPDRGGQRLTVSARLRAPAPTLPPPIAAPAQVERPAEVVTTPAPQESGDRFFGLGNRLWGISLGTFGLAAVGAGVAMGVLARQRANDIARAADQGRRFEPAAEDSGRRYQTLQIVFTSVGATALAAGTVLYALHLNQQPDSSVSVAALVAPGFTGASLLTAF
jgi:tetratricopeptide (TPR) repeat protein